MKNRVANSFNASSEALTNPRLDVGRPVMINDIFTTLKSSLLVKIGYIV